MKREAMEFDVAVVGGGPAGLAAAIRLKQIDPAIGVCLIDKGAEIGAHIISGAIMDARALAELCPDWQEQNAPLDTPVSEERFLLLTATRSYRLPTALIPACCRNDGNYVISLGDLCRWLGQRAQALGVEIYPGFVAADFIEEDGAVRGVVTGDMGVMKSGEPGPNYQPGMELRAKYTLFAEGCRGHLGKRLEARFRLRNGSAPQAYSLGIKELWQVPAEQHSNGLVMHSAGWPLDRHTHGGGFCYHYENANDDKLVSLGLIVDLGYTNPHLSPFEETQRLKTHPAIYPILAGGKRLGYGARVLTAGGLQALPRLIFPGGALIGDDAGFLVAARGKGCHAAIKSGMLAAEAAAAALAGNRSGDELAAYPEKFRASWLFDELSRTRNFRPLMSRAPWLGGLLFGIDQQRADGELAFDLPSSLFLSNIRYAEGQPCHLRLKGVMAAQHYCPAGVYEIVVEDATARLQINAQNCLHCKACDIKNPDHSIEWTPAQGGDGPLYSNM